MVKLLNSTNSAGVTNTLTLPAGGDQEIVGTSATQTLTNKTITGTFTGNLSGHPSTVSQYQDMLRIE